MGKLLSCPFCRELFSEDEGDACPECGLPLVPLSSLPLSIDGEDEAFARGLLDPPEHERLPLLYWGRGRGTLLVSSLMGLSLFFQPWVSLLRPEIIELSAFDLARANAPWLWGGAVGWFIMIPLIVSRRSVHQLRGVRIIATLFPAMTLGEVLLLLLKPPNDHAYFSSGLSYEWGIYASGGIAIFAALAALRLGGSIADLRDLPSGRAQRESHGTDPLH